MVDLSDTEIMTIENAPQILKAMRVFNQLQDFSFDDCLAIGSDEFIHQLTLEMLHFPQLQTVSFRPVRYSSDSVSRFASALGIHPQLINLRFILMSTLPESTMMQLIQLIPQWQNLADLRFDEGHAITDNVALSLAEQIPKCSKLKILAIRNDVITLIGAAAIIQATRHCRNLQTFQLSGAQLTPATIYPMLAMVMPYQPALREVTSEFYNAMAPSAKRRKTTHSA